MKISLIRTLLRYRSDYRVASKMDYRQRIESHMKHLFDGNDLNVYEENVINLSAGTPSEKLLKNCNELINSATQNLLDYELKNNSYIFQYGPTCGTFRYRTKLAEFLTKRYQSEVHSEDLVLTAGATNGLHLILSTLIDLNGVVFLDEVTYMIALESIRDFSSLKVIPVKLNDDGVDLKDLEDKILEHKFQPKNKMFHACYYTIPTFHNPTGILFSDEICQSLIHLARKHDVLIACDDVYNLLHFDDEKSPKRLFEYDSFEDENFKGNVISNGTFSKILAPGIRVGWMECPPRIVQAFRNSGFLKSGGGINNYTSGVITSLIELGLADKQLDECIENYKTQRDSLIEQLVENLPKSCSFIKPRGGYFVWIKLPEHIDGEKLSDFILENFKVFAIKGNRFSIENKCRNYLRLTFAFHSAETLSRAGKLLCEGITKYLNNHQF